MFCLSSTSCNFKFNLLKKIFEYRIHSALEKNLIVHSHFDRISLFRCIRIRESYSVSQSFLSQYIYYCDVTIQLYRRTICCSVVCNELFLNRRFPTINIRQICIKKRFWMIFFLKDEFNVYRNPMEYQ